MVIFLLLNLKDRNIFIFISINKCLYTIWGDVYGQIIFGYRYLMIKLLVSGLWFKFSGFSRLNSDNRKLTTENQFFKVITYSCTIIV